MLSQIVDYMRRAGLHMMLLEEDPHHPGKIVLLLTAESTQQVIEQCAAEDRNLLRKLQLKHKRAAERAAAARERAERVRSPV